MNSILLFLKKVVVTFGYCTLLIIDKILNYRYDPFSARSQVIEFVCLKLILIVVMIMCGLILANAIFPKALLTNVIGGLIGLIIGYQTPVRR